MRALYLTHHSCRCYPVPLPRHPPTHLACDSYLSVLMKQSREENKAQCGGSPTAHWTLRLLLRAPLISGMFDVLKSVCGFAIKFWSEG